MVRPVARSSSVTSGNARVWPLQPGRPPEGVRLDALPPCRRTWLQGASDLRVRESAECLRCPPDRQVGGRVLTAGAASPGAAARDLAHPSTPRCSGRWAATAWCASTAANTAGASPVWAAPCRCAAAPSRERSTSDRCVMSYPRHTACRRLIDQRCYEGAPPDHLEAPTPLGRLGRQIVLPKELGLAGAHPHPADAPMPGVGVPGACRSCWSGPSRKS